MYLDLEPPDPAPLLRADTSATAETSKTAATQATTTSQTSSGSWWGYVGWTSAPIPLASSSGASSIDNSESEPAPDPIGQPLPQSALPGSEATPQPEVYAEVSQPDSTPQLETSQPEPSVPVSSQPELAERPESISDSVKTTQTDTITRNAWYAPWSWYVESPAQHAAPKPAEAETTTEAHEDPTSTDTNRERQLTESEMIKEEALARPSPPSAPSHLAAESEPQSTRVEPLAIPNQGDRSNDESQSQTHTPSSSYWASFFTSPLPGRSAVASLRSKKSAVSLKNFDPAAPPTANGTAPVAAGSTESLDTTTESVKDKKGTAEAAPPLTGSEAVKLSVKAADAAATKPGPGPSPQEKDVQEPIKSPTDPKGKQKEKIQKRKSTSLADNSKDAKEKPESKRTKTPPPRPPPPPNLVLPTWGDTFHTLPRSIPPSALELSLNPSTSGSGWSVGKLVKGVLGYGSGSSARARNPHAPTQSSMLRSPSSFSSHNQVSGQRRSSFGTVGSGSSGTASSAIAAAYFREKEKEMMEVGRVLPRALDVLELHEMEAKAKTLRAAKQNVSAMKPKLGAPKKSREDDVRGPNFNYRALGRKVAGAAETVVVIGVHGWFPGAMVRTVMGEPTGTSAKFVNMMAQALGEFQKSYMHGEKFDRVTLIPLEGEGTIGNRVEK